MQWNSWAIYRDLTNYREVVVLTDSSKWWLFYRGPFDWKIGRTPQMEQTTVQFQWGHAPL